MNSTQTPYHVSHGGDGVRAGSASESKRVTENGAERQIFLSSDKVRRSIICNDILPVDETTVAAGSCEVPTCGTSPDFHRLMSDRTFLQAVSLKERDTPHS